MSIDVPLIITRSDGNAPGTVILHLTGPVVLRNLFELQPALRTANLPAVTVLDFSAVPYMDSAGMGAIINFYVHCQHRGARLVVAAVSPRVLELFRMTRVDTVIRLAATVEEAEQ